jgi:transposase
MDKYSPDSIDEISQADWEKTPESVRQLLVKLIERIEQLERQHEALRQENQLLKEQLK